MLLNSSGKFEICDLVPNTVYTLSFRVDGKVSMTIRVTDELGNTLSRVNNKSCWFDSRSYIFGFIAPRAGKLYMDVENVENSAVLDIVCAVREVK